MWNHQRPSVEMVGGTYGLEVAMDNVHRMQVPQSAGRVCELRECFSVQGLEDEQIGRTKRRRLTSGCFDVKSMMFPSTIHSVMMHSGNNFGETPNTAETFGWESRLQMMISWNKRWQGSLKADITRKITCCKLTCLILDRLSAVYARNAFMHTRFPLWRPLQTSANPPEANGISPSFEMFSESVQERGRMVCWPHTLRRMRILFLRRSISIFGASNACAVG